jgi:hypothetical protein
MFSTLIIVLPIFALAGFLLIDFGAVNLVPVLFSLAVAAQTTTGFAGILAGPTWAARGRSRDRRKASPASSIPLLPELEKPGLRFLDYTGRAVAW